MGSNMCIWSPMSIGGLGSTMGIEFTKGIESTMHMCSKIGMKSTMTKAFTMGMGSTIGKGFILGGIGFTRGITGLSFQKSKFKQIGRN